MAKIHISRVDGIRGIAIILVVCYHFILSVSPKFELGEYDDNTNFLKFNSYNELLVFFNPIGQGWIGVNLFLVISGFLIHYIYIKGGRKFESSTFFNKRFWRIYPPYLLVISFFIIIHYNDYNYSLKDIIYHVFLIHNLDDNTFFSINPSFWSIALECQLYLIYPLYLFILKFFRPKHIFVFLIFLNILLLVIFMSIRFYPLAISNSVIMYWFVWCGGAYMAENYVNKVPTFRHPLFYSILFYSILVAFKFNYLTFHLHIIPATIACMAFFEYMLYNSHIEKYTFSKKIYSAVSFIGLISYSLYLIHQPIINDIKNNFGLLTKYPILNVVLLFIFVISLLIVISYAMYEAIEKTSINIGKYVRKTLNE